MDRATAVWSERVTIVLHHVSEDEGFEGGYEAVTMSGVPHGVSVVGSDRDRAEVALNHLLDGLRAFRFVGWVDVEDATEPGPVERYEFEV